LTGIVSAALISACGDKKSPTSPTPPDTPTISSVSPNNGTTFGGTTVTISGTQFAAGATVLIGGTAATDVAVQSPTSLTAKTAQHAAGAVPVSVTVNAKTGTMASAFTYVAQGATTNAPPVIASFKALGSRRNMPQNFADVGETITITAYVTDEETAIDQLTFEWSSPAGSFSGTGPVVSWTAPGSADEYELKLTVIEKYQSADANGLPVQAENRTSSSVKVSVHDSKKEVAEMGYDFLVAFSKQQAVSTVLKDFTDSCRGADDEQGDVENNQKTRLIQSWNVSNATSVDIAFGGVCKDSRGSGDACINYNVEWHSLVKGTSKTETSKGVDQVSAVYQGSRWWLCSSFYTGTTTNPLNPFLRSQRIVTQ
jgi:hypothetical protein